MPQKEIIKTKGITNRMLNIKSPKECKIAGLKALPIVIPKIARAGDEKILGDFKGTKENLLTIAMETIDPKSHGSGV